MNDNIRGGSSSDVRVHYTPDYKDTDSSSTKVDLSTGVKLFEGMDFINNVDIIVQEFSTAQQSGHQGLYPSPAQTPGLPPPNVEGLSEFQPFEPSWRRAVNKDFMDQLRLVLMKKEGLSSSTSEIETRIGTIIQMITSGKTADLSAEDKKVVEEGTKQIQTRWKLPTSWFPGTKEVQDWTPIAKDVVPPINIELSRREVIANNLEELMSAFNKAAQRVTNLLPPDHPQRRGIADIIEIIAKSIRDLKNVLQDIQLNDYQVASKSFEAKKVAVQDRNQELSDIVDKMNEAMEARREQEKTAKVMRIVAPAVSALVILVGVVALPFTAGGSSVLIIAGLAVASVMLAYTAVDSAFNITSKAVQGFNKWLEETFPGDQAWKATVVKALVLTALVVILIVAVVATGGGAAANVATATTAQIVKQAVLESIKQLTIQFTVIAIMSSNILPDLVVQMLISSGAVKKEDEQTLMIIKMVIAVLTMIVVMFAVSKGMQRTGAENVTKTETKTVDQAVKLSERIQKNLEEAISKIRELINEGIKSLKSAPANLKEAGKEFLAQLDPRNIKEGFASFGKGGPSALPQKLQDIFRMMGLSIEIGFGFYMATLGFKLAKVYEEMGELQKAEEMTKMLIKLLDQLLASFQEGINTRSEWLANLDGALNSLYASGQNIINKATQYSA